VRWFVRLLAARVGLLALRGDQRDAEMLGLRHQVHVLRRQVARPRFTAGTVWCSPSSLGAVHRRRLSEVFLIVQPATVLGWYRRLVACH
jgi:hypothetical protein